MSVTTTYRVDGMTCGHCAAAVREEMSALSGVVGVQVDLHPGETSLVTVSSQAPLAVDEVAAAIDEAGYRLVAAG